MRREGILFFVLGFLLIINTGCSLYLVRPNQSQWGFWGPNVDEHLDEILKDPQNMVPEEFKPKGNFARRVRFWLSIYVHYSSNEWVIHHRQFPWIVFSTVKVPEDERALWRRVRDAEREVKKQRETLKLQMTSLASKIEKDETLSSGESELLEKFQGLTQEYPNVIKDTRHHLRYQVGQRDHFIKGLKRGSPYLPMIERVLTERNLPPELARLPFVESSFNLKATSRVGASGIWQIMPFLGKRFMIVNHNFDERRSPHKSTQLAARILDENYRIFKKWPLAITAYNHGSGNLRKLIRKLQTEDLETIIEKEDSKVFEFASGNFFASFVAALFAERYRQEFFGTVDFVPLTVVMEIADGKTRVQSLDLDQKTFLELNPDVKKRAWKNNLKLPKGFRYYRPEKLEGA